MAWFSLLCVWFLLGEERNLFKRSPEGSYFKLILKENQIPLSPQAPASVLISEAVTLEVAPASGQQEWVWPESSN